VLRTSVPVRVRECAGVRVCVRTCVRVCGRAGMRVCGRAGMRVCVRTCVRVCVRSVYTHARTCVRVCMRTCVRACFRSGQGLAERAYIRRNELIARLGTRDSTERGEGAAEESHTRARAHTCMRARAHVCACAVACGRVTCTSRHGARSIRRLRRCLSTATACDEVANEHRTIFDARSTKLSALDKAEPRRQGSMRRHWCTSCAVWVPTSRL
jgi:hypothetical protein